MALRARRAGKKKAHTGVAVWAFTLSRYRAGGLLNFTFPAYYVFFFGLFATINYTQILVTASAERKRSSCKAALPRGDDGARRASTRQRTGHRSVHRIDAFPCSGAQHALLRAPLPAACGPTPRTRTPHPSHSRVGQAPSPSPPLQPKPPVVRRREHHEAPRWIPNHHRRCRPPQVLAVAAKP